MILPIGTLVNALAIILGSICGLLLHNRFPDRIRIIVFQGLGLCVLVIGLRMAFKAEDMLLVIFSVLLGGISGELMRLDRRLDTMGDRLKGLVRSKNERFTEGLVTASLIFCIGAMAIVGSFDEAIRGDRTLLYTKSVLDAFASIALAASYGLGVLFSFLAVLIYQGLLTLFAGYLQDYLSPLVISQLTGAGGVLILGIGITLLDLKSIKLANLLPALVFVVLLTMLKGWASGLLGF
ncbi:hypothetical protein SAMN02745704_02847 [Paucidesulfovibrio gracilis DSM 16080]|uniref:DUF554 domain-containing protein n=1 Tax=Paucidesulfovibrio gracilis DSM 16080 TaxID=1121449 RepID=A0A1T4Y7Z8_9BACT|nr:DUF554 domain-containing protein [Paucidesulfovibrio gracilis]SKA97421.1 hypothetical protein SAMN02745704_02847 [Paucidesulfovibrio gracilis DSM 16080]